MSDFQLTIGTSRIYAAFHYNVPNAAMTALGIVEKALEYSNVF